jgi:hypothetical protein
MFQKNEHIYFLIIFLIIITVLISGCPSGYPDKAPSHFEKVDGKPNTFQMVVIPYYSLLPQPKERVSGVKVYETSDIYSKEEKVWWEIRAKEPVDAKGLEVIAGQVPDGFEQIDPAAGQIFKPVKGKKYYIAVDLENPLAIPWVWNRFIAD